MNDQQKIDTALTEMLSMAKIAEDLRAEISVLNDERERLQSIHNTRDSQLAAAHEMIEGLQSEILDHRKALYRPHPYLPVWQVVLGEGAVYFDRSLSLAKEIETYWQFNDAPDVFAELQPMIGPTQ